MNYSQSERYDRNILMPEIGFEGQKKLANSKVLVCGAGGLGSTVLLNLASLGIGHIGIIDNDIVELSNLNRQYIHSPLYLGKDKVESAKCTRLNAENYKNIVDGYNFIVDCFDSFESKFLLNDIALDMKIPLVHGGVTGFCGQVMTIIPKESACLRCILPQDEQEYMVKGIVSPTVSTIASIESMEVLKLILNIGEPLINKILVFDGLQMKFKTLNIEHAKSCKCRLN